jgi:alkanesulfonate monooxygenase SsuD/methylene tetrahydromethanopterin reductase-like flavin-dependent oxidoreductase (luciferase family)
LVGTAERIASELEKLSGVGLDGVLLSWARYEEGLQRFISDVLPLLEQAGLRTGQR